MTAAAERRLWGLAAAVSVALHIMLVIALVVIPVPHSASSPSTHIVLLSNESRAAPVVSPLSAAIAAEVLPAVSTVVAATGAQVDRTIAALAAPLVATGVELSPADWTMLGSPVADRQDVAAAARTDLQRIEPLPGLETSASLSDDAVVVPVPSSSILQPRPQPEIAGPAIPTIARQAVDDVIRAAPYGSGRVVASSSMPEPVQPRGTTSGTAALGQRVNPLAAVSLDHPPAAGVPTAETATIPSGIAAIRPTASSPPSPHALAQTVAPSSAEAMDRRAPPMREPAARPVPPGSPQRIAAIMRPVEPLVARSREEVASAYADLLSTLRASRDEGCLLGLASLVGQSARIDRFVPAATDASQLDDRLTKAALPVDLRTHAVTPAQCAALDFAASIAGYPEPVLSIKLVAAEITSGAMLSGRVSNLAHRWAFLFIVDDEGRVHELTDLALDGGRVVFQAPVTLTDGPVGTVQLLFAIASDAFLASISQNDGHDARVYFDALGAEIERTGGRVEFGMVPFLVR